MRSLPLFAAPLFFGLALTFANAPAGAQDHMGTAELHGQGVVNSYGNQIRSSGIRSSMKGKKGSQGDSANPAWPKHITPAQVGSHVFRVEELRAMNDSDRTRTTRMLTGRTISVTGIVSASPTASRQIFLHGADGDMFKVAADFANGRVPRPGTRVTISGNVDRVRGTMITMRNARTR